MTSGSSRSAGAREKIRFASRNLTAHGDELREAALAGCGIVRLLACHVEDELRSGALVQVLPDWECLGGLPIVAIYRKDEAAPVADQCVCQPFGTCVQTLRRCRPRPLLA